MVHRVDAPLDIVEEGVARPLVHRADQVPFLGEDELHGIVESTAGEPFDIPAIRPAAPDAGGEAVEMRPFASSHVVSMPAVGPVEEPIGSPEGAVDVAAIAVEVELGDHFLAAV